jgi:hypothetical protein
MRKFIPNSHDYVVSRVRNPKGSVWWNVDRDGRVVQTRVPRKFRAVQTARVLARQDKVRYWVQRGTSNEFDRNG